jgi:hypothetical protein
MRADLWKAPERQCQDADNHRYLHRMRCYVVDAPWEKDCEHIRYITIVLNDGMYVERVTNCQSDVVVRR